MPINSQEMMTTDATQLMQRAEELLTRAEREQQKAEEDVVSHLICGNARQALNDFLMAYLQRRNIVPEVPVTLAGLARQCRMVDARFDTLDISNIHCRFEDEYNYYCVDREHVDHCLNVAQLARSIVTQDTPPY